MIDVSGTPAGGSTHPIRTAVLGKRCQPTPASSSAKRVPAPPNDASLGAAWGPSNVPHWRVPGMRQGFVMDEEEDEERVVVSSPPVVGGVLPIMSYQPPITAGMATQPSSSMAHHARGSGGPHAPPVATQPKVTNCSLPTVCNRCRIARARDVLHLFTDSSLVPMEGRTEWAS